MRRCVVAAGHFFFVLVSFVSLKLKNGGHFFVRLDFFLLVTVPLPANMGGRAPVLNLKKNVCRQQLASDK